MQLRGSILASAREKTGAETAGKTMPNLPGREARYCHISGSLREMRGNQMMLNLIDESQFILVFPQKSTSGGLNNQIRTY